MIDFVNSNIAKVLTIFSISPGSRLNRKMIKEKTNMPNLVLDKTLYTLINLNVLIKEKNLFLINHKNTKVKEILSALYERYSIFKQLPLREYFLILNIKDA